jgi:hypothetical protein
MFNIRCAAPCGAVLAIFVLAGCGDNVAKQVGDMNKSNIQRISNLYAAFQNTKGGGRGPKDQAELAQFIKEFDPNKLQMMGVNANAIEQLFTSERDGKPFRVRYKVGGGRGSVDPVTFEQEGKDGKKQVGFTGGKVEEVDDARYQAYLSGKKPADVASAGQEAAGRPKGRPTGAPTGPMK